MMMLDITTLNFIWPRLLWLLASVPFLALAYWVMNARRSRVGRRYINLEFVGEPQLLAAAGVAVAAGAAGTIGSTPSQPSRLVRWRRHFPPILTLLALVSLFIAVARPQAVILLPTRVETIMLAIDMSGSMRATDVKPTRMVAAQAAAKAFMEDQPRQMRVGVVSVAAAAAVVQAPTTNREDVAQAIDRLQPQRGTALGSGIVIALSTLLPGSGIEVAKLVGDGMPPPPSIGPPKPPEPKKPAVPAGSNTAAAIVLVTDGASNTGPDPVKMAELAAEHGVRVFTVGIGTPEGATVSVDGFSLRVRLEEEQLKKIAATSSGEYFRASSSGDLKKIYKYISASMAMEKSHMTEVTALFVALGALLAMVAGLMSMAWYNRVV
jgi:Ca-activated chloride channel family protein